MAELASTLARTLLQEVRRQGATLRGGRASQLLWLLAILSASTILLPITYLILRVAGTDNLAWDLLVRSSTWQTLLRTLWLAISVTATSALIAIPLAWFTARTDLPFRRLWSILAALPLVIPSYVGAFLMVASLGPRGMIVRWVEALLDIPWTPPVYGFPGALYVLTLLSYPYTFLSVRAALHGVDPALEEAARGLGYTPWKTFWRVTLPQLRPAIAAGSLLVGLYVLRDFGAVSIMRFDTFTRVIYTQYQSTFDRSSAAALALILVILTLLILTLEVRTRGHSRYYNNSGGAPRPARTIRLGNWRWPALAFCMAISLLALGIPSGVLLFWLARGLQAGERILALWGSLQNSFIASALAAATTVFAALPVALISVRRPGRLSWGLERLTYAGFALPGIVVSLALVFFGANYARVLYQTLPLLLLAYLILFLPQAVGALRTTLLQIHPNLEEAARGLGRSPLQTFTAITLPLTRSGVLAASSLVFLTTMKELPATLILAPFGFRTLATSVWSAVSEAFFAQAAGPALMLILASSLPMAILVLKDRL